MSASGVILSMWRSARPVGAVKAADKAVAAAAAPFSVSRRVWHDSQAFTQGLVFYKGALLESTGLYGQSTLRRVDPRSGKVLQSVSLEGKYFGEGITVVDDKVIMLTWRESTGFVFDAETLELVRTFQFSTTRDEGWGIAYDGTELAVTDGSANVHFWDPVTLEETRRITVKTPHMRPVTALNELEYVNGELLANIWYSNKVARIDTSSGRVLGFLDFTALHPPHEREDGEDVFNGLAYDPEADELYATGKLWKHMFRLKLRRENIKPPMR